MTIFVMDRSLTYLMRDSIVIIDLRVFRGFIYLLLFFLDTKVRIETEQYILLASMIFFFQNLVKFGHVRKLSPVCEIVFEAIRTTPRASIVHCQTVDPEST